MKIMGIESRGHFYEILNYKKGFSKEVIRKLAACFKVSQEAFTRPYALKRSKTKTKTQPAAKVKDRAKKQTNKRDHGAAKLKQNTVKGSVLTKGHTPAV